MLADSRRNAPHGKSTQTEVSLLFEQHDAFKRNEIISLVVLSFQTRLSTDVLHGSNLEGEA